MTIYKLSAFVGEAPSVSDRALGAGFARRNVNLFLPSGEFWPLGDDRRHSACLAGTKTMHRFSRDTSGAVIQNPGAPISSYRQELSIVKGQINDEATERSYLTTNDGSERPRAIDIRGNNRQLGVVRPVKPVLQLVVVDEFTADEAQDWLYGDLAQGVWDDMQATVVQHEGNQEAIRWDASGKSFAGVYSNHGLRLSTAVGGQPPYLYAVVSAQRAAECAMDLTRMGAIANAGGWAIPVSAMPYSYPYREGDLAVALALRELPDSAGDRAGEAVFTSAQVGKLVELVKKQVAPGPACDNWRGELDRLVAEFAGLALNKTWSAPAKEPVKPTAPTSGQWVSDGSDGVYESSEWRKYQADLEAYYLAVDKFLAGKVEGDSQAASLNSRLIEIQQRCATLVSNINAQLSGQYTRMLDGTAMIGGWLDQMGGVADIVGKTVERVVDSRFYVVAFVTDWGEESQPSPVSDMVEVDANDRVVVRRPMTMTGEAWAARNVTRWRIYRSNTSDTATAWQLVQELAIEVDSFNDDKKSAELDSLQPQFTWAAPPYRMDGQFDGDLKPTVGTNPYLRGLVGVPNGIMAGFLDNTVAFCEPYVPYAWPVAYQITTEFPVVGMGVFDQTIFVGTTGNPYLITGAHSANMSATKQDSNQSCAARRSIVGVQGGVLYASPDGLCHAGPNGVEVVTRQLIAREDWQKLQPASMFAGEHEGVYYLFYAGVGGGCLAFSMQDGWKLGHTDMHGTAVWVDKFNDLMYLAQGEDIVECFTGGGRRAGVWKTGLATQAAQLPLAWAKVYGDQSADAPITLRLWGDGQLRHTATFTNLEPQRLPPGRWLEHQVEIEGKARATTVMLCSTTQELRGA